MSMKNIKKICICCPAGCHLEIAVSESHTEISGNKCPRGRSYAEQELSSPHRVVTAAVVADGQGRFCIPVKSDAPLPKDLIAPLLRQLSVMHIKLPIGVGDVVIRDFAGTGVNIVCTGDFR